MKAVTANGTCCEEFAPSETETEMIGIQSRQKVPVRKNRRLRSPENKRLKVHAKTWHNQILQNIYNKIKRLSQARSSFFVTDLNKFMEETNRNKEFPANLMGLSNKKIILIPSDYYIIGKGN